ncbi:glycosyltransferase family 2 protein [Alkalicaulis satelles]|uniref:Glycosyltransferase family 2 protein n=1 Tax=Alkalicaulis satelles TaxID=2609175 RepID=A0A5M6ZN10_9PROT|nr:glycosyltransferase family 2 protein [Alkalicaulis satelles]KAA5803681.1 glycosyltransferase family 2 protein [Alkalicaulis satelles]
MRAPASLSPADVTILIVAHRSAATIPHVIAALEAQTLAPSRVRLLENGSAQGERVEPEGLPDWVEFIDGADNLGFAGGNNLLARGVETRWLLLLNPDAYPEPDWLEQMMAAVQRWPEAALFGCTQHAHGAPGVLDGCGDVYHFTGLPYRSGYGKAMDPPGEGEVFGPCGAAALIRRDVFEALGGFDEDYFCYVEDVDLAARARLLGHRAIQVREAAVSHVGYSSTGRRSAFATYHGARNRLWTFFKVTPGWLLWVLAPVHLGVTALLWLSAARFGQFALFGKALRDALAGWPGLMAKRRALQRARVITPLSYAQMLSWNPLNLLTRAPVIRERPVAGQAAHGKPPAS